MFICFLVPGFAQELNCHVRVNLGPEVQTNERRVFNDMERSIAQFLNERKWTNDNYRQDERINCNLIITIERMTSISSFRATAQIQSSRPIYNTNYESLVFYYFGDKDWVFDYVESQPLNFNDNAFENNLTSILAFYAYVIIGLDHDSFQKMGGSPLFERALNVVNNAQQSNRPGWNQFDGNINRYWLIENLMSQQMIPIREGIYNYHRIAMDNFLADQDNSRKVVLEVLKNIQKVDAVRPNSMLSRVFFDAKIDEMVNMLSKGDPDIRRQAYTILVALDPTQSTKYRQIINN